MSTAKVNYKLIKKVHTLARQKGLSEDDRRAVYESAVGKNSLVGMTEKEITRVIDALSGTASRYQGVTLCNTPMARKARSLWLTLRDLGALRDPSEAALLAYVKSLTCMARMEWLNEAQMALLIETLKKWIARIEGELTEGEAKAQGLAKERFTVAEKKRLIAEALARRRAAA